MKTKLSRQKLLILLVSLVVLAGIRAQGQTQYTIKSSKITIEGTSSLHDWTSEATKLEWSGSFLVADKKIKEVSGVQVRIPVTAIKSTKGKMMDNKTYEAFKYEQYPAIVYKLSSALIENGTLKTNGTLTMAGTTKSIEMMVTTRLLGNGDIQITGSQKINMKDYKMEPPTAMMGTIEVGEEVTIKFDLTVATSTNL
jgi:polyisoprenoid-binding protein YceI